MLKMLIDGDMFAFRACASCETEIDWGNDIWTLHVDLNEAKEKFSDMVEYALSSCMELMKYTGDFMPIFCFSDKENFRKAIMPTYKANRAGKRKPVGYKALVEWVTKEYTTKTMNTLEADDVMGIIATKPKSKDTYVIVSGDKDLKSVGGHYYDFIHDTYEFVSPEQADFNFLKQTLMGDRTDGYDGCPSIGKVTAEKILNEDCSWDAVVKTYEKKGLSEEVALENARVARILRYSDYDAKKKKVILWKPTVED